MKSFAALGVLFLTGCADPLPPLCSYGPQSETLQSKAKRLGETSCKEVIPGHNQVLEDRINIVFIGVNTSESEHRDAVERAIDCSRGSDGRAEYVPGLMRHEPFASKRNRFNFWYAPEQVTVYDYATNWDADGTEADEFALPLAAKCGLSNTVPVIVPKWYFRANANVPFPNVNLYEIHSELTSQYRKLFADLTVQKCKETLSSCTTAQATVDPLCDAVAAVRNVQDSANDASLCSLIVGGSISFGDIRLSAKDISPLAHELGHAVFNFNDEYIEEEVHAGISQEDAQTLVAYLQKSGQNCYAASSEQACISSAPWKDLVGHGTTGCYHGCFYAKTLGNVSLYRPEMVSTMLNAQVDSWGSWHQQQIRNVFLLIGDEQDVSYEQSMSSTTTGEQLTTCGGVKLRLLP